MNTENHRYKVNKTRVAAKREKKQTSKASLLKSQRLWWIDGATKKQTLCHVKKKIILTTDNTHKL